MLNLSIFIIILLMISNKLFVASKGECNNIGYICSGASSNCRECIRKHHCCEWCYDKDFSQNRCFAKNSTNSAKCDNRFIEHNAPTSVKTTKNDSFANVVEDVSEAIQFSPQEFNVSLRYNEPVNISIQYQPAKNFPLDLYYLMDLTLSMKPDLDTLKTLGSALTTHLKKLTANYRIAFGSYIDKTEMPFYLTDPRNKENPCAQDDRQCEKGYLFKHKINFTQDVDMFIEKVKQSDVSANSDDLEGGMDAVMQILFCGEKLGWLADSRKLILVATDGGMHLAGDGILAGYTKINEKECLIDYDGNYVLSQHYDYPSLAEIHNQLKKKKTNIIVAAKSDIHDYYKKMRDVLEEAIYVGELQMNSSNVLNLVDEGYYSFIRKVNLFASDIDGLKVDFFADCDGNGKWQKKQSCMNAEENKKIDFKIQLRLTTYETKEPNVLYIHENNIQEKIQINLHYVGSSCMCPKLIQEQDKRCVNGQFNCGDCLCEKGWSGDNCSDECITDHTLCRQVDQDGTISLTCSGRGDCMCKGCTCNSDRYQGRFCEHECPYDKGTEKVCGHGICNMDGVCECEPEFIENACSCHNSTKNCKIPGFDEHDNICSGQGKCQCNTCKCKKGFSGAYCEHCDSCRGLCDKYEKHVFEHVVNKNLQSKPVRVEIVEDLPEEKRACVYRYDKDGKKCDIFYEYTVLKDQSVVVKATEPACNTPLAAGFVAGLIIAAFLALTILIVIVWKGRNWKRDRDEYQKFELTQKQTKHSEVNPIYKNPVTSYRNPMEMSSMHSKDD